MRKLKKQTNFCFYKLKNSCVNESLFSQSDNIVLNSKTAIGGNGFYIARKGSLLE